MRNNEVDDMRDANSQMKALADSLWNNYFQPKVADATRSCLRLEKATVKTAPSGGTVAVQFPFDDTVLNLPYVSSLSGLTAGQSVWVGIPYSDLSNGVVMFDATFQNL